MRHLFSNGHGDKQSEIMCEKILGSGRGMGLGCNHTASRRWNLCSHSLNFVNDFINVES